MAALRGRCCDDPGCRRRHPIGVYLGDFDGRVWAATRSRRRAPGAYIALEKHDVTRQVENLIRDNPQWARRILRGAG